MSRVPIRRAFPGCRFHRALTGCVIATLVTSACGTPGPRAIPAQAATPAEGEGCEDLARRAEARVQGGSAGAGAAMGAAAGALAGVYAAARADAGAGADEGNGAVLGAFVGGLVAVGGLIGAAVVVTRNASVRRAAHVETLDVCLRPAILSRELGPEHVEVAWSLHALAFRYLRYEEFARAEPLLARALAIQEKRLGVNAPEVAAILDDYAFLLRQTGRVVDGEAVEQRAREIRSRR